MTSDTRVDAYVDKAGDFARPILQHLRQLVHRACPDADETIKWGMPMFLYRGKIVADMAAFKAHASFGTWRRDADSKPNLPDGMGQFGKLTGVADLPPDDEVIAAIGDAMKMIDSGGKLRPASTPKPPPEMPEDLRLAVEAVPAAAAALAKFPPSAQREYYDWVTEAKQPATRARRIAQAVEWCAEGKRRNWKHEAC